MHFQFLVEDYSGAVLVDKVMLKLSEEAEFTFDTKSFKGIGGFKERGSVKDIKTNKLLTDLPQYLRAFDNSLRGIEACVIVVLDNDTRDTRLFENELEMQAQRAMISIDHVFCVAVEEMEAWLLCQTAHCGRCNPRFVLGEFTSPIVPYRNLPQAPDGMTADCCSLV